MNAILAQAISIEADAGGALLLRGYVRARSLLK